MGGNRIMSTISQLNNKTILRVEKRLTVSKMTYFIIPVISIVLALCVGGLFIALMGYNTLEMYTLMFQGAFGSAYGFSETIVKAIPLMLAGLGVAIAFKMLLWNIGAEGQIYMGAFTASWVALFWPNLPPFLVLPVMVVAGFLGGAIWGLIPAIPRALLGVDETITTLMLNYVAILWVDYLVYGPWKDPDGFNFPLSAMFPSHAMLPIIPGTRIHAGLIMALIAAIILFIIVKNTTWGYQISVIGESQKAARYAGINIKKNIFIVMFLSGGLAGLAGMAEVSGIIGRLQHTISVGYGYTAIIIAYLSKLNSIAIIIVSILFGGMLTGGYAIQVLGLPAQVVSMLQGAILFFVLGGEIFTRYQIRIEKKGGAI
jgi:ABC-type uncharacterized transport system permease subunit